MLEVGGIISDYSDYPFDRIRLKPLEVGDMLTLFNATQHRSVGTLVNLIQSHVDIDVTQLRVLDFKYILHWLKQKSYPENVMTVTWTCTNWPIQSIGIERVIKDVPYLEKLNSTSLEQLGYERAACKRKNTTLVYNVRTRTTQIPVGFKLPKGYKFPLVRDLLEAEDLLEEPEYEHIVPYLMWLDCGTLKEALELFDWYDDYEKTAGDIERFQALPYGTRIMYDLKCNRCDKQYTVDKDLDIFEILPAIDQQKIMDLQYNIFGQFQGAVISEDTPVMKLLYWHSCLVKDKQKQEEERRKQAASKSSSMSPTLAKHYGKR